MLPLFLALMTSAAPPPPLVTADLLLVGGKIWAGKGLPRAEALAVRNGRVLAIGRTAELLPLKGPGTRVIELHGQFVIPGFNDAHLHFLGGGQELLTVDLRKTRTLAEFLQKFGEYLAGVPEGRWVTRGRWDHEVWNTKTLPTRWDLDRVSPKNPVLLPRVDGHMVVANSEALKVAGVTRSTTDPPGGTIDRRADGEPTGILRDTAIELVRRVIPAPSDDENLAAARAALKEAARFGITSVQDNSSEDSLKAYLELKRRGELTARISYWRDLPGLADLEKAQIPGGMGDEWVRFDAIKVFADGSLGSATASMHEPYEGHPENRGLAIQSPRELATAVREASRLGFSVHVHAIGDRANTAVLDAFAALEKGPGKGVRLRIEHAQLVRQEDVAKFAALKVIASIQPCHALTDMLWASGRIGTARLASGYRIASFRKAGVEVAVGTDWPVEPLDPRRNLYAAVARAFPDGTGGWTPEEKIGVEDALDLYTRGSAAAEGQDSVKGTLQPGRLADLAVFTEDLIEAGQKNPRSLLEAKVVMTISGGRVVFASKP